MSAPRDPTRTVRGVAIAPLALTGADLHLPFGVAFETVADRLERLPRMFFEPDGSFVWVAAGPERTWQVDGHLYDRNGALLYMELKGACPDEAFDSLLQCCGWPEQSLAFQLAREALVLDEADFRRWANSPAA